MISISGKQWVEKKNNKNSIEKLKQDHNFSEILSNLIISRKFDASEIHSIDNYLELKNMFSNNDDFKQSMVIVEDAILILHPP